MLAVREHDAGERDLALVLHGVADYGEGFLSALAFGDDVVRALIVALVDVFLGDELVDVDRVRALDLDRLKLLGLDLDILAARQLVAAALSSLSTTLPVSSSTICWRRRLPVLRLIWWKLVLSACEDAG
jgi:hypothetical protein